MMLLPIMANTFVEVGMEIPATEKKLKLYFSFSKMTSFQFSSEAADGEFRVTQIIVNSNSRWWAMHNKSREDLLALLVTSSFLRFC